MRTQSSASAQGNLGLQGHRRWAAFPSRPEHHNQHHHPQPLRSSPVPEWILLLLTTRWFDDFSPKTVKIKSLMIMHLRWLTKTWQTSKQPSLDIDHQHESHLSLLLLIDHKIARWRPTRKPWCVPPFLKVRTHCLFIRHFDFKELLSNRQVVCLIPLHPPKSICSQRRGRLPPTRCPLDQTNQGWRTLWWWW